MKKTAYIPLVALALSTSVLADNNVETVSADITDKAMTENTMSSKVVEAAKSVDAVIVEKQTAVTEATAEIDVEVKAAITELEKETAEKSNILEQEKQKVSEQVEVKKEVYEREVSAKKAEAERVISGKVEQAGEQATEASDAIDAAQEEVAKAEAPTEVAVKEAEKKWWEFWRQYNVILERHLKHKKGLREAALFLCEESFNQSSKDFVQPTTNNVSWS